MILTDFHTHSSFSSDSEYSMNEMIHAAIQHHLKVICFTEHHDIGYPENTDGFDFMLNYSSYKKHLLSYKETNKTNIEILFGIELGLMPDTLSQCSSYIEDKDFDFIIGSTHIIDYMDPYDGVYFKKYPGKIGMKKYFEDILYNVTHFEDYDVYGHLDYASRYIKDASFQFDYTDYTDILDQILKTIIANGKGIEVNTAGWKYGMFDPNPHRSILKRYLELGGKILTIGSDGHKPEHLAYDFQRLPEFLKDIGFKYYTIFRKRKPEFISL